VYTLYCSGNKKEIRNFSLGKCGQYLFAFLCQYLCRQQKFLKHVELERVVNGDTGLAEGTPGHAPAKHDGLEIRGRVGVHRCRTQTGRVVQLGWKGAVRGEKNTKVVGNKDCHLLPMGTIKFFFRIFFFYNPIYKKK